MMKQPSLHKHMCMSVEHINTGKLIPVILSQGRQWAMFLEVQYITIQRKCSSNVVTFTQVKERNIFCIHINCS